MTETGVPPSPATPKTPDDKKPLKHTIIPLPKIIFFYPCMLVAFVCGIMQVVSDQTNTLNHMAGSIFVLVFLLNILVISFDFPGVKALALALLLIAILFALLWLNDKYGIFGPLKDMWKSLHERLYASAALYFTISAILLAMIMGGILVNLSMNRWTIYPNRLVWTHGILGNVQEYPVIDLKMEKEIEDVFEFILLFSGTLTFTVPNSPQIRLENIPFINRAEQKIRHIIRSGGR